MVWLVTHMWMALGIAAVCGLSFGWAVRGLSLKDKARDAIVARDVALTELNQSKLEIDQLYAAQSKGIDAATGAGDEALRAELETREARLQSLGSELANSQAELENLKSRALVGAAVSGVAGAVAATSLGAGQERLDASVSEVNAAVEWRNRYLESRVRALETQFEQVAGVEDRAEGELETGSATAELEAAKARIEELEQAAALATTAAVGAAITGIAANADEIDAEATPEEIDESQAAMAAKSAWQAKYMRQRLAYIETHGFTPRAPLALVPDAEPEETSDATEATPENADAEPGEMEQELARLRWRNRYLEGRLAYIDGDAPKSDAELAEEEAVAGVLDIDEDIEAEPSEGPINEASLESEDEVSLAAVAASVASMSAAHNAQMETSDEAGSVVSAEALAVGDDFAEVDFAEPETDTPEIEAELEDHLASDPNLEAVETATPLTDFADTTLAEASFAAPADTFLATLESGGSLLKPDMVAIPADGGDDLTRINGIGGQTSEMLQDLGIWLYSQIAAWSPENVAWVNQHFNAETRVEDEQWIAQAVAFTAPADAGTA